jgi:hypothetical protein
MIINLPIGKYTVGNNAYICTATLPTPFAGAEQQNMSVKDSHILQLLT